MVVGETHHQGEPSKSEVTAIGLDLARCEWCHDSSPAAAARPGGGVLRGAAALPAGTVDTLLKPENKDTLDKILTYHVVSGRLDSVTLDQQIANGGGKAVLKTVQGEPLTVQGSGKNLMVTNEKGGTAHVTIVDVYHSNGVIQVVDRVLLPN